ncbi:hypothetical protein O0L34_g7578 [Tuta absoluta]|nr:hypothetical protein O0L34_g7578 [Tuta absoluta]
MVEKNPGSVVNVCNLKPAMELVRSWEDTVSEDTPENKEMVEFVQNEAERGRRAFKNNSLYVGNFPEMFLQVVANSTVFQYPYLLPAGPYRADNVRKFGYRLPEDELIALGLDQFWEYVEANPELYSKPRNYRAGRWGLVATCNLMVKHMFPWQTSKWLQYHIHKERKNKDNPIAKFFATRHVKKVEHRLLPYNPKLTLYEQPEYEMPKIWVRYLAKTSKRFRYYKYRRAGTGVQPHGVPVTVDVRDPIKNPLPPDFTKTIVCTRKNLKPKPPEVNQDSFDLVVEPNATGPMLIINPLIQKGENPVEKTIEIKKQALAGKVAIPDIRPKENIENTATNAKKGTLIPVSISKLVPSTYSSSDNVTVTNTSQAQTNQSVLSTMYTVVQTSLGAYLIPLTIQNTNTVNSITAPIPSTFVVGNDLPEQSKNAEEIIPESSKNVPKLTKSTRSPEAKNDHCQCCVLIRKICKKKQARITDFFKAKKTEEKPCDCTNRKFPKVTKRLRMLVDNYKSRSWCEQRRIREMLNSAEKGKSDKERHASEKDNVEEYSLEDIEYVTTFHMKLTRQSSLARNVYLKTRITQIFSKFDPEVNDPITLSEELFQAFDVDLIDLYKEFMGFLTAEQADMIDGFKDYFVHSCVGDLVKRVENEIQNKEVRKAILNRLNEVFTDNVSSSCDLCASILATVTSHPRLASHVFSLFPHRAGRDRDRYEINKNPAEISKIPPVLRSVITDELKSPELEIDAEAEAALTKQRLEEAEPVDNLTICDDTLVPMEYGDDTSSTGDYEETTKQEIVSKVETDEMDIEDALEITEETIEGSVVSKTETQDTSDPEMSPLVMSEDDPDTEIKSEPAVPTRQEEVPSNVETTTHTTKVVTPSWNREEDKFILELIQKYSTPESCQGKEITENLEANDIYQTIAEKFPQKCIEDIRNRVMRILDILVVNTDRNN